MDQSEPASTSNLNDEFETIYDVLEEADIEPPSETEIAFWWFVYIVSGFYLFLVFGFCFKMWRDQLEYYWPFSGFIEILLISPIWGVWYWVDCILGIDNSASPDVRRWQIEKQDMLRSGRYSVTCSVGVFGHKITGGENGVHLGRCRFGQGDRF